MLRFVILALLVLLIWRGTMLLLERAGSGVDRRVGGGRRAAGEGEELVRCAACGTRIPASRAVVVAGRRLCSAACGRPAGGAAD